MCGRVEEYGVRSPGLRPLDLSCVFSFFFFQVGLDDVWMATVVLLVVV